MYDLKTVMSWLEGLTEDDWEEWYSHSKVQNMAKAAIELLKKQEATIEKYRKADGFLIAHGWKWEGSEVNEQGECYQRVGMDSHR